ncbi:MAG: hypothetical protein GY870_01830 [archaeon]|nr:hypothetical protein [archaeon]
MVEGEVTNTKEEDIEELSKAYDRINPDKIQLYTISRYPPESNVEKVSYEKLVEVKKKIVSLSKSDLREKIDVFPSRR